MKKRSLTVVFSSIFLSVGCQKSSDSETTGWGVSNTSFNSKTLTVCYERRSFADVELVSSTPSILQHAQSEFSKTNLALVGLGPCGSKRNTNEVRVSWLDAEEFENQEQRESLQGMSQIGNGLIYGSYSQSFPQRVASPFKADPTLVLNSYAFKMIQKELGISTAVSYFKSVFMHEMGHAVGLLHEHAQAGSTCTISKETVQMHFEQWQKAGVLPSQVSVVGTKYDPYSIMNYCYILERGKTVSIGFSVRDIQTVNALYPKTGVAPQEAPSQQINSGAKPSADSMSKPDSIPEFSPTNPVFQQPKYQSSGVGTVPSYQKPNYPTVAVPKATVYQQPSIPAVSVPKSAANQQPSSPVVVVPTPPVYDQPNSPPVAPPVYQQPSIPSGMSQPASSSSCNYDQFQICKNYGGGYACYAKWKCWNLCPSGMEDKCGFPL